MDERRQRPDHLDTVADFYSGHKRDESDRLMRALETWDYDQYRPLQIQDPDLHRLICDQLGFEIEILVGRASVKLGGRHRHIELTWNGDVEDLVDLCLEGAKLVAEP